MVGYGKCHLCILENKTIAILKRRRVAQAGEQGKLWEEVNSSQTLKFYYALAENGVIWRDIIGFPLFSPPSLAEALKIVKSENRIVEHPYLWVPGMEKE